MIVPRSEFQAEHPFRKLQ